MAMTPRKIFSRPYATGKFGSLNGLAPPRQASRETMATAKTADADPREL